MDSWLSSKFVRPQLRHHYIYTFENRSNLKLELSNWVPIACWGCNSLPYLWFPSDLGAVWFCHILLFSKCSLVIYSTHLPLVIRRIFYLVWDLLFNFPSHQRLFFIFLTHFSSKEDFASQTRTVFFLLFSSVFSLYCWAFGFGVVQTSNFEMAGRNEHLIMDF